MSSPSNAMQMRTSLWTVVATLLSSALWSGSLVAAAESRPVVTATGHHTVELAPRTMRLQIDLLAQAATPEEALSQLEERTTKAVERLAELGADRQSIELGDPRIHEAEGEQEEQLRAMVLRETRGRSGRLAERLQQSKPIKVSRPLTAVWDVASKSLLDVHKLQASIREADVSGLKHLEAESEEEQEMTDEFAQMAALYGGGSAKRGEPVMTFLARFESGEKQQALAEAYADARQRAETLAAAAGRSLGEVVMLSTSEFTVAEAETSSPFAALQMFAAMDSTAEFDEAGPPASSHFGRIRWRVTVNAHYELK